MFQSILDPRLGMCMPTLWPSLCTIQAVQTTTDGSGQEIPSGGINLDGLVDIPCHLGPITADHMTDNEHRTSEVTGQYSRRELKMNGYYVGSINPRTHRAVVDGVAYHIRGVEGDSEKFATRVYLENILPTTVV